MCNYASVAFRGSDPLRLQTFYNKKRLGNTVMLVILISRIFLRKIVGLYNFLHDMTFNCWVLHDDPTFQGVAKLDVQPDRLCCSIQAKIREGALLLSRIWPYCFVEIPLSINNIQRFKWNQLAKAQGILKLDTYNYKITEIQKQTKSIDKT